MLPNFPVLGSFAISRKAGSSTTPFAVLIPPYSGQSQTNPSALPPPGGVTTPGTGIIHVMKVCITAPSAQVWSLLRPWNWGIVTTATSANGTTIVVDKDMGKFSNTTCWRYPPLPGTPSVADYTITSTTYVVYQSLDGTWKFSLVTSLAGTSPGPMTLTVPAIGTTTAIAAGSIIYLMGTPGTANPNTGQIDPQCSLPSSSVRDVSWSDPVIGVCNSLHQGDPMLCYSPGTTAAATLEFLTGIYAKV